MAEVKPTTEIDIEESQVAEADETLLKQRLWRVMVRVV